MNRKLGLLGIVFVSALIVACVPPAPAAPAGTKSADTKPATSAQAVEVKTTDTLKFEPATVSVKKGIPVQVTLANAGALEHDWVVDNLDGKKVQVHTGPKASATAEFTPMASGSYVFYCSIPGHREAGMTGTLTVQ